MKPILVNGFFRSGTTYLYRYLEWISNGKVLLEPITTPYNLLNIGLKNLEIFKSHPKWKGSKYEHFTFFYDENKLLKFLSFIKDYHIKETTLHLYLDEKFIVNNWRIFLIIRHPADTYLSFIKFFYSEQSRKFIILILERLPYLIRHFFYSNMRILYNAAEKISRLMGYPKPETHKEAFVLLWTFVNYHALNSIDPEKQLIIYEDPESYYKLPKWEEWMKIEPLRIRKYKARRKYEKEFYDIAKKLRIEKEFKELMEYLKK